MLSLLAITIGIIGAGAVYGGEYAVYTKVSSKRAEKRVLNNTAPAPTPAPTAPAATDCEDSILTTATPEEIALAARAIGCADTADLMSAAADGRLQAAIQNLRIAASQLCGDEEFDYDDDLWEAPDDPWEETQETKAEPEVLPEPEVVFDPTPEQTPEEVIPPEPESVPEEQLPPRDKNGKFIKKDNKK